MKIIRAKNKHVDDVSVLFNLYRQFYKYKSDLKKSKRYISKRIFNEESVIFICFKDKNIVGFVQLYETFDSLNLNKKLVLYDLYVQSDYRKKGIARNLMNKSKDFAKKKNYGSIELSTATSNIKAQSLYESLDYIRDKEYYNYELEINH